MYILSEHLKRLPVILIAMFAVMFCGVSAARSEELPSEPPAAAAETTAVTTTATTTVRTTATTTSKPSPAILDPAKETKTTAVIDVPYYSQSAYPTGCELVSTSMLLAFHGYDITAGELVSGGYITAKNLVSYPSDESVLHGGDPNESFIGSPNDSAGFGCYSGAIVSCLDKYLAGEPVAASCLDGMSLEDICSRYIDNGYPVLIWASISMVPLTDSGITWIIGEHGDEFTWLSNEHCLVLVGYDENNYIFNDPLKWKNTYYSKSLVEQRYEEMGEMAVAIVPFEG